MKLLYPEFLWALTALAVPVIIHLFNFRKFKKVYFSNLSLLKEVKLETKSKSQLKHLVVLLIRMLTITCLVLAFAQPYVPASEQEIQGAHVVSVYIDNSQSMDTRGENGYLLELAKEQAIAIANSYEPTDEFQLLTNDFEGRHQRIVNRERFIQQVEEVEPSYAVRTLGQVYMRQSDALMNVSNEEQQINKSLYWLSDFQKNMVVFEQSKLDSSLSTYIMPYTQVGKKNLYIDSIWFDSPVRKVDQEELLYARVINQNPDSIEFSIEVSINDQQRKNAKFTIRANDELECLIPYTVYEPGIQNAALSIANYPDPDLTFDDHFYFSYHIEGQIKVLYLSGNTEVSDSIGYVQNLFRRNEMFALSVKTPSTVDYSTLKENHLVIVSDFDQLTSGLSSELTSFIRGGGSVALFPGAKANINSYNSMLASLGNVQITNQDTSKVGVTELYTNHPIYHHVFDKIPQNVDLPEVFNHFNLMTSSTSGAQHLMELQNGSPFLTYIPVEKGKLFLCASPLDKNASNFPKHALFVPTMLRIGEISQSNLQLYYTIGKESEIELPPGNYTSEKMIVQSNVDDFEFIPEIRNSNGTSTLLVYDQINAAGNYTVLMDGKSISGFSFNNSRIESVMDFFAYDADEEGYPELEQTLDESPLFDRYKIFTGADSSAPLDVMEIAKGVRYWTWCLLGVLLLLAMEILLLRLWK